MRLGNNPNKDKPLESSEFFHQILIPVYVPHQKQYFKDSFVILNKCIESILSTINPRYTFITIVNNGSCAEVENFLLRLKKEGKIQEVINTTNIGKLNAINKGVVGHNFDLVTIADADTIFLSGWQEETLSIFNTFPKAGTVGLVPQFNMFSNYCTTVLYDNLLNKNLQFFSLNQPKEMQRFYHSIGWNIKQDHYYLKYILGLQKEGMKVCIGAGHFVATYRKKVLNNIKKYVPSKMGAESERLLDKAAEDFGLWKLTTFNNYAYHMGNVYEPWMENVIFENSAKNLSLINYKYKKPSKFSVLFKNKIFKRILRVKAINNFFFIKKQLPYLVLKQYPKIYY
ncbi:glycosyltransferase family 2 protein [Zunongwangia sp. SCSIO 43204]|uniref:glycosyltransferase family A protein n=1 Tax=Zunongwangia sp. SCSIO 43204 TaxID=2779359 RepID=UPI001CA951CD|nr:glycosyltransferase family A protein [Zunongwangia sp. SCSIO 43204]UAB86168.1 glycosyltransferase family 2 protein [Zunongwangia sp. SCSIO 43204]